MFHVLLVAPVLGLLAVYGIIVLVVLSIPFCLGGFLQLVFSIAAQDRWVIWVPAGLVLSAVFLLKSLSWGTILLYWGLYFLWLWLIWLVVRQIRGFIRRKLTK